MGGVSEQGNATALANPRWQRVAVHKLPVDEVAFGRLFHDGLAHRVPSLEYFVHVL